MDIQVDFYKATSVFAVMFLLFKTDFLIHYLKLFGLEKKFRVYEYIISGQKVSYLEYLKQASPSFFTSLIGCPYCIGFWATLFFCSFEINTFFCYSVYIFMYKLINKI